MNAMPPIKDIRVQNAIVNYSDAAKAWWIALRCNIAPLEQVQDFKNKLAKFTALMDMVLATEFSVSMAEANKKYTQVIQMYALNDMSANKFYGCGKKAKDIWHLGYTKTQRVTSVIQTVPLAAK